MPIFVFILLVSLPYFTFSQKNLNPTFSTFKGTAYELPKKKYNFKYHPKFEKQTPIAKLEWNKIDIPETPDVNMIPEIGKRYGYCILFNSVMNIKEKGWYKFSLTSDDGSVLWIDKKVVVQNDGTHQMRLQEDSIALQKGIYPIKIWYYQGFPDRYGIQFKSSYYRKLNPGEKTTPLEKPIYKNLKMVIPNQILNFEHDKFTLEAEGKFFLDSLCNKILTYDNISKLIISGHTDNIGNDSYNAQLSMKRSIAVREELKKRLFPKIQFFEVKGFGESKPIDENTSAQGRAKNRRVEIEIIFKPK